MTKEKKDQEQEPEKKQEDPEDELDEEIEDELDDEFEEKLEEELEVRQGETPVDDETGKDKTVAPVQYNISSYGADYDVEGLVNRLKRKDILIPKFQRQFVWSLREASEFIESLLLGLPVPAIFFVRERNTNKLNVIDGQQRLKTLQFFYEKVFNPKKDEKRNQVFKLTGVQAKFEGKTYETLEEGDRVKLNDSVIHAIIVKQESPKNDNTSIYHIFDRLNSKGRRLTPQEIRTALYHGKLISLLKILNKIPAWRNIYGKPSNRLKDRELILRFLAMYYYDYNSYKKPMSEFLTNFCEKNTNPDEEFIKEATETFKNTTDAIWNSLEKRAFRLANSINAAVYDSVMMGVAKRLKKSATYDKQTLRDAYDKLLKDQNYLKEVSQSTADENNLKLRMKKAIEAFDKI